MRLIKLLVDEGRREAVVDTLRDEDIDFVLTEDESDSDGAALFEFPLPVQAVEYVLDRLRETGLDDGQYTVITSAETAKTTNYKELEDRFVAGLEEDDSVAREEIRAKALGMHRNALTYYSMTLFSAIVAVAGLLLNSPAVVVGAMVIAPQVGSAMISSVGMAFNDRRMIRMGFQEQVLGLGSAIVSAFLFGLFLKQGQIVTSALDVSTVGQISKRISPGLLSVSVALCAGGAGAFGLATALPVSLVGVMVAAALIPAAAAVGIGLAWGLPSVAVGALVLLLVNVVAVNVAGFVVLWYLGYRPDGWTSVTDGGERLGASFGTARQYGHSVLALCLLLSVFVVSGGFIADQMAFTNNVNTAVEEAMKQPQYEKLEVTEVHTDISVVKFFDQTPEVTVVVARPAGEHYPKLASTIRAQIDDETTQRVIVDVKFEDHQRTAPRQDSLGAHPGSRVPVAARV